MELGVRVSLGGIPPNIKIAECFGTPSKTPQKHNRKRKLSTECDQQNYLTYFLGQHVKVAIPLPRVRTPLSC